MKPAPVFVLVLVSFVAARDTYPPNGKTCYIPDVESSAANTYITTLKDKSTCRPRDSYEPWATDGCSFFLKCAKPKSTEPGFYFEHSDGGPKGLEILCDDGTWIIKKTKSAKIPKCKRGCLRLSRGEMVNATFKGGEPDEIYETPWGQELYPLGTVIETRCKENFIFTNEKLEQKGYDRHTCSGDEGSGWFDDINNSKQGWPGRCFGVCQPWSKNLPDGVEIVDNPETNPESSRDYGNGTIVLLYKSRYTFRCKNGYKAADPIYRDGVQHLYCDGEWSDLEKGTGNGKPLKCLAQGCPAITKLPPNALKDMSSECGTGEAKPDNCTVTIKCAKNVKPSGLGYYMPYKPNGFKLKCVKGTWVDESGNAAIPDANGVFGGECKPGCVGLSPSDQSSTNVVTPPDVPGHKNDDVEIYEPGSYIKTECRDDFLRPNLPTQPNAGEMFQCTIDGWKSTDPNQEKQNIYPATCVPGCEVPSNQAGGTSYDVRGTVSDKKGRKMVQTGATIISSCHDKFKPPTGTLSPQTLECVGGNSGWKDPQTTKTNELVLRCERDGAVGCPPVVPQPGTEVNQTGNCDLVDGMLPPGCKVIVKCKPGFVPEGSPTVNPGGEQPLDCVAGNSGYINNITGSANQTALKCVPACEYFETMHSAIYVQPPNPEHILPNTYAGKKYLSEGAQVVVTCKRLEDGFFFNNDADMQRANDGNQNVVYKCLGGDQKYEKVITEKQRRIPGDCCGPICNALEIPENATGAGTNLEEVYNAESITFKKNAVARVVNVEYKVSCKLGYEFPEGSKAAQLGKQNLLCVGGDSGYVELSNNATNQQLTFCVKSEDPRCPPIDSASSVAIDTADPACVKFTAGCRLSLKCQPGYFPDPSYTGYSDNQSLTCKVFGHNFTAYWSSANGNEPITPLKCTKGCPFIKEKASFQFIMVPQAVQIGGVKYYNPNTLASIRCNPGFIPRIESNIPPQVGEQGVSYECRGGADGSYPWMNQYTHERDKGPGELCVKTCPALKRLPEGVAVQDSPREKPTNLGSIVSGGGIYTFFCHPNYHYEDPRYAAKNQQKILCDPDTGNYVDISGDNTTVTGPAPCRKDVGDGCRDLPIYSGKKTSNCSSGYQAGCTLQLTCDKGFIPSDPKYYQTGTQNLVCPDGNEWTDSNGNKVYEAMKCVPACKFDPSQIKNAVVNQNTVVTVTVNNVVYVLAGTKVPVTCKGDGVIWTSSVTETNSEHNFICGGGNNNFTVEGAARALDVHLGEGCVGTCILTFTFNKTNDPTIDIKQAPAFVEYNNQKLVTGGDGYIFTCAAKHKYPSNVLVESETFKCNPDTRRFEDATSSPFVKPTSCVREAGRDECKALVQSSEVNTIVENCPAEDNYFGVGCIIKNTCKQSPIRFKPVNPAYHTPEGIQQIRCIGNGIGWADQFGQRVTEPLKCEAGCVDVKELPASDLREHRYDKTIDGVVVPTVCLVPRAYLNGSYQIDSNYYACLPSTSSSYYNITCTHACREILGNVFRSNNLSVISMPDRFGGTGFVHGTTTYVLQCAKFHSYPPGSPYALANKQTLKCNGETGAYEDLTTNNKNATVAPCVKNAGCKKFDAPVGVSEPSVINTCSLSDGAYNDLCTLEYKCKAGYYPTDLIYLYGDEQQKITCKSETMSWIGKDGNPVQQLLQCKEGCAPLDYEIIVRYLNQTGTVTRLESFIDNKGGEVKCYTETVNQKVEEIVQKIQKNSGNPYFCKSQEESTSSKIKLERSGCPDTCEPLNTNTQMGTSLISEPAKIQKFMKTLVTKNGEYLLKCDSGYEYDKNSPEGKNQEQRIRCVGNGTYQNVNTGEMASTFPIKLCQKARGCEKLRRGNSLWEQGPTCTGNELEPENCYVTAKCPAGSYPTQKDKREKPQEKYVCTFNSFTQQSIWVYEDERDKQVVPLECTQGCLPIEELNLKGQHVQRYSVGLTGTSTNCTYGKITGVVDNIPKEVRDYFCILRGNNDQTLSIAIDLKCIEGCYLLGPFPSISTSQSPNGNILTYQYTLQAISSPAFLEPRGSSMTLSCPAGKQFDDTRSQMRTMLCAPNDRFQENGKDVSPQFTAKCV